MSHLSRAGVTASTFPVLPRRGLESALGSFLGHKEARMSHLSRAGVTASTFPVLPRRGLESALGVGCC
jgi:hypothetical protein